MSDRRRNPALLVVAAGVLLAALLVIASSRRATQDAAPSSSITIAAAVTAVTTVIAPVSAARATAVTAPRGMASVRTSALPAEARATLVLVDAGGPFPYAQDGAVFQNRERLLPTKSAGYYREYTVTTPGSDDRGARRVVAGQGGERYYTDDHYESFRLVIP